LILIISFIFGAIIGSFLNVCIYRLPRKESIITPGSHCLNCNSKIKWYDNIPILSYIILKGKCRNCKAKISLRYPLVEILTSLSFMFLVYRYGITLTTIDIILFITLLIVITFIDFAHQIILDKVILFGMLLGFILGILNNQNIISMLLGSILGGTILYVIAIFGNLLFKKESMGGGDIKFSAMLGIFLGWKLMLLTIFLGFIFASIIGIVFIYLSKAKMDNKIPFGPFLSLASVVSLFLGEDIINWYLNLIIVK
jgi:leader peptidase (prepilin peptidase)/N-methyltransferase